MVLLGVVSSEDLVDNDVLVAGSESVVSSSSPENGRAAKRRRLTREESSPRSSETGDDGDGGIEQQVLRSSSCIEVDDDFDETDDHRTAKSKYLMHVPEYEVPTENQFVTQLTQPPSPPERIRGPRWRKRVLTPSPNRARPPPQPSPPNPSEPVDEFNDDDDAALAEAFMDSDIEQVDYDAASEPLATAPERRSKLSRTQSTTLRQRTLLGGTLLQDQVPASQSKVHNWPLANRNEPPTHHQIDKEAMTTWVYPTNLGRIRDYQYTIVQRGLFSNLLVALPTGLGKTFIAATIMLNWFRWTKDAQIIFVAPTKPLVFQQRDACFNIVGIPRSVTCMLTGDVPPAERAEEWKEKRVFFMTPQTLVNDLKNGMADPKKIVLLVVDEAHRAAGNYAYVEVVKFLRRFNASFRILALTATPGSSVEAVQKVIDSLDIARVEIRTEESLDIRDFVHRTNVDTQIFDNTEEMAMALELFSNAVRRTMSKLNAQNAYWGKDPCAITVFGLHQAREQWKRSEAAKNANWGLKGMVLGIFGALMVLAHALHLLKFHGFGPFYHKVERFEQEALVDGQGGSKYAREIVKNEHFQELMKRLKTWINNPDFEGHPKLTYLKSVVRAHFMHADEDHITNAGRPHSNTKIMVFAQYRDSAEEIVKILNRQDDMVRASVFVGQAKAQGSEGMDQKTQLEIIDKFKKGTFNVLVATSIGEEGLDIGEVDLIVCYDSSASPIRMLQRMGRTGRRRAGKVVVLLMRGKEEDDFAKSKDNYGAIQKKIAGGREFNFHDDKSRRIVPREIAPVADKRHVEIPVENTQPEIQPRKRGKTRAKKPAKKFHMPDGVDTGFVFLGNGKKMEKENNRTKMAKCRSLLDLQSAALPLLDDVLLTAREEIELDQGYAQVAGAEIQYIQLPRTNAFPEHQRSLRLTAQVQHSRATQATVQALRAMRTPNKDWLTPADSEMTFRESISGGLGEAVTPPKQDKTHASQSPTVQSSTAGISKDEYDCGDSFVDDDEISATISDVESDIDILATQDLSRKASAETGLPFYLSQKSLLDDEDIEDELPDITAIVSVPTTQGLTAAAATINYTRKRTQRVVLDDDDDDNE